MGSVRLKYGKSFRPIGAGSKYLSGTVCSASKSDYNQSYYPKFNIDKEDIDKLIKDPVPNRIFIEKRHEANF